MNTTTNASPSATPTPTLASRWRVLREHSRNAWALSKPYFLSSDEKWRARLLLASVLILNLATVYMSVVFNDWNRAFYDALQNKNTEVFWTQLGRFTYLAFGSIVLGVYYSYLSQLLGLRWRAWMTQRYQERWLANKVFYQIELTRYANSGQALAHTDNPDQRMQEDVRDFTGLTLSMTMGLLNSLVTLCSFVGILWTLSGAFSFSLRGNSYVIPGFMLWVALLYAAGGSLLTHLIGRVLIGLNFTQQVVEADFRHRMMRVREFSEAIALERGQGVEREQIGTRFTRVVANYLAIMRAQKKLNWFTSFYTQASIIFPFVVAAPRYFSNAIPLGQLTQIADAFGQVQGSLSWLVGNYTTLAQWRATTDRLTSFETTMQSSVDLADATAIDGDTGLATQALSVRLPDGSLLLDGLNLQARAGDSVLLSGPSGSGKSTLFRTLAGIWPYASGNLFLGQDSMFMPQRPYFPNGPLRHALAYPDAPGKYQDAELQQALRDAQLAHLADQLDVSEAWSQALSGGEQQRLALARVLLKKPRWIFADEASSALDEASEAHLYQTLQALVAQRKGALVSIAHRPGAAGFHTRHWMLQAQPATAPGEARFVLSEKSA